MKKIFTLLFSLGLLTAAFAQGEHRQRDYNSGNGSGDRSWYQADQQKYGNDKGYQATPYSSSDNWNYQSKERGNEHRFRNEEVNNRDGFGDRDDMRGGFDNRRFNDRRFSKGFNRRHLETYRRKPAVQIFFGFGSRHE